jgi:transposase InsO family protein
VTAYRFIQENLGEYRVREMTDLFGVSRGAYYKWFKAGCPNRDKNPNLQLIELIREIVLKNYRRYGILRVRKELWIKHGINISRKKVAKLMRENGLNARRRRKYIPTTDSKHSLPVCENILNREFTAEKPGEKWVSDITYLRTLSVWIYLTVVLDLFDRKVIGWAISDNLETCNTTIPAFEMAVKNRQPESGLIFHSDRGVQYCAYSFCDVMRNRCPSVRQSMSRKGNCWDNACAESFFKTLKSEEEKLNGKYSAAEVRQTAFYFVEVYYNRERTHSVLDYLTPNEYYLSKVA